MKRLILPVLLVAIAALPASATEFFSFEGTADCDGYQALATIQISPHLPGVDMESVVTVTDADGIVVHAVTDTLFLDNCGTCDFVFAGTFEPALEGGPYTVTGTFTLLYFINPTASFEATVTCGVPPTGWCPRTPGYWKNHAEDWPVEALTVGGVELSQSEALAVFRAPVRGDATVILAKHLMAAMLNLAMGAEDMVGDTIDQANAYLMDHPVGSRPRGAAKQQALMLKDVLADWNETECHEGDDDADKAAAIEGASWSTVKGLFR